MTTKVAVEPTQFVVRKVHAVVRMFDALTLRGEQLARTHE